MKRPLAIAEQNSETQFPGGVTLHYRCKFWSDTLGITVIGPGESIVGFSLFVDCDVSRPLLGWRFLFLVIYDASVHGTYNVFDTLLTIAWAIRTEDFERRRLIQTELENNVPNRGRQSLNQFAHPQCCLPFGQ